MALNIQEMAQSAYNVITQIQNAAVDMVGLETLWCRATPEPNSEDIILQEYTLTNVGVECPKMVRVVTAQSDYNPGNFTVDLFGVSYDAPFEVSITIEEWKNVFGPDSMPQQGDVVYVKMLHKLFEVKTSQVIYTIASMPTYYKCQLVKYTPTASRRETEEFKVSIDELTVSQEELFGDAISQEVADNNIEVETAYNTTSYVDPMKDFDMNCIVRNLFTGPDGNVISSAYYDFRVAKEPVVYHTPAVYSVESERNHWIFTCWFRSDTPVKDKKQYALKRFALYQKDKKYWYFRYTSMMKMNVGDKVTVSRGALLSVNGEVVNVPNEENAFIRFAAGDMRRLERKLTNWYGNVQSLKITKADDFNIISSDTGNYRINYSPAESTLTVQFGNSSKSFKAKRNISPEKWMYLAADLSSDSMEVVISQLDIDGNQMLFMNEVLHETVKSAITSGDFKFGKLYIDSCGTGLNIRNIRLYENEYPMEDTYHMDMFSQVTRNASKMIVVDGPNVKENREFISPVR